MWRSCISAYKWFLTLRCLFVCDDFMALLRVYYTTIALYCSACIFISRLYATKHIIHMLRIRKNVYLILMKCNFLAIWHHKRRNQLLCVNITRAQHTRKHHTLTMQAFHFLCKLCIQMVLVLLYFHTDNQQLKMVSDFFLFGRVVYNLFLQCFFV